MGRGKIEIKKIENQTNRQVTYSKRRNGLFKKAHELTVLCDAQVSIILISNTKRQHDYCSPSTTHKQVYDRYQQVRGEDLWSTHYEKMQNELKSLMEKNEICNRKIRQRTGKDLGGLAYNELHGLEQMMEAAVNVIRERKCDKLEEEQGLLQQVEMHERCRYYGNMGNGGANHKTGFKLASQASHIFAFGGETLSTKSP